MTLVWVQLLTHALVGALMVGGSLGRSLIQGSDVTGLAEIPGSSVMKYVITGQKDEQGHWTEEVILEHGDEDWQVKVDHINLDDGQENPKFMIITTFSAKSKTPGVSVKDVVAPVKGKSQDKGWVFQLFPKSHLNWFGAETKCKEWGGHLAIPDTQEKVRELTKILDEHIKDIGESTGAFLGFSDLKKEGHFITVLGKPLFGSQDSMRSPLWFRGDQPDDDKSWSEDGEDCGSMRSGGGLNDVPCLYNLPYICEKARGREKLVVLDETNTPSEDGDEEGEEEGENTLQLFPRSSKDWNDAKDACVEWGGHMAVPDSEAKMRKMIQMLDSPTRNPEGLGAFVGFSYNKKTDKFVTIIGEPMFISKDNWHPEKYLTVQPEGSKDITTDSEDCGYIRPGGGLTVVSCKSALPYFCEKSILVHRIWTLDTEPSSKGKYLEENLYEEEEGEDDDVILELFDQKEEWFDALEACEEWGGNLAIPNSRKKMEEMVRQMKKANVKEAFLGFGDQAKEGHFVTVTGALVNDSATWSPSWVKEDDSEEWFSEGEDCGSIQSDGFIDDISCMNRMPFFCEKKHIESDVDFVHGFDADLDVQLTSSEEAEEEEEAMHFAAAANRPTLDDKSLVLGSKDKLFGNEEARVSPYQKELPFPW